MKKRSSISIFQSVVHALFLREVQTRFGTKKLGYLWAIIDPFTQIFLFATLKTALHDRGMPGIDYVVFLATSFLTYNLFKHVMTNSMSAFNANKMLFNYKQVKPFDTIVSRFVLEFLIFGVAVIIFMSIGIYFEFDLTVKDFNMVLLTVLWISVFAFGIGLLFAVLSSFYESFSKIISYITMPLFFISGLFYTAGSLPPEIREILLYNPILHFIEMIHGNYFLVLDTQYVDYEYMMYWTFLPLFFGLYFYINSEKKIISSL